MFCRQTLKTVLDMLQQSVSQPTMAPPATTAPPPPTELTPFASTQPAIGPAAAKAGLHSAPPPTALPQPSGIVDRERTTGSELCLHQFTIFHYFILSVHTVLVLISVIYYFKLLICMIYVQYPFLFKVIGGNVGIGFAPPQPTAPPVPSLTAGSYSGDDPPGLQEKAEFILREWVTLYHNPNFARDTVRAYHSIVTHVSRTCPRRSVCNILDSLSSFNL